MLASIAYGATSKDQGGDTLDTSTPIPTGIESLPNRAKSDTSTAEEGPNPSLDSQSVVSMESGFLMPIEGDVFFESELRVLVSLTGPTPASMVLLMDGYPEHNPLSLTDGIVKVQIQGIKSGAHHLALLLFNERTEIIGKLETRFFIRLPEPPRKFNTKAVKQFGRVVAKVDWKNGEAKGRILNQSELKMNPANATTLIAGAPETSISQELEGVTEAAYNVKYKQVEAYGKVLLRTDEDRFRQPAHRLTTSMKYGPWVGVKAGDIYPLYNSFVLNGTRIRGGEARLSLVTGDKQWGSLRFVRGESRRAVPTYQVKYDTGNGTRLDTIAGTFAQNITAARLGFGGGPAFDLGLTFLKASDRTGDPDGEKINNIVNGPRPSENVVPGLDLRIGMWDGKIQLYGNSAMSLYTRDRSLGAFSTDSFDVSINPEGYKNQFIFNATTRGWQYLVNKKSSKKSPDVMGFIGTNSAYEGGVVASLPMVGVISETDLRYSHLGLDYHSEGNPFLGGNPGDGFTLLQKLIVFENRLSLGMELGNYTQDLGVASQTQRNLKVELRFTPGLYQPSFWVGGGRSNIAPDGEYAHQFSSSFLNFNTGGYHQFQLPTAKLHATLLYGFTQSEYSLLSNVEADTSYPVSKTHIVNGMLQYKIRNVDFLPRMAYTYSQNGIQLPTNSVTMGFLEPFLDNAIKLDLSGTVGQYPESNTKNDVSLGAAASVEYVLGPQQTFRLRERWSQYGQRRNLLVGANFEMFF